MNRYIISILPLIVAFALRSQELHVTGLRYAPMDLTAATYQRKDLNGEPCGLAKISLQKENVSFEGNIIGIPEYKNGEYWVYLTSGTKFLKLKHQEYMPLVINFVDYNISSIEGKATYEISINYDKKVVYNRDNFLRTAQMAKEKDAFDQKEYEDMIDQYRVFVEVYNQWWDDVDEAKELGDEKGLEAYMKVAKTYKMVLLWEGAKHMAENLDLAFKNNLFDEDNTNRYLLLDVERRKLHNRISKDGEGLYHRN